MIPTQVQRDIIRSGKFEETKMSIAKGSEAYIFNILRNSTYNDPIGSPIREYIANALDEHIKFGKAHVPVEVTFPNAFQNELRVRDFGAGLSDEDVVKFFANYGASDKRESNDLMGAFGIGCKSAFAYTDSFSVVSYKNGTKTTFNLYIDETNIGSIARLTANKTSEPNGVEIVIPVKPQDVSTFVQRGLALVKYFKTKPLIKGVPNVPDFERNAPLSGDDWKYFGDRRESVLIQGQVGYPIDVHKLGQVDYYAKDNQPLAAGRIYLWEYNLLNSGLEIDVPIGSVEVTASRESLQMTPKTIKAVREALIKVRDEIIVQVSAKFKTAKTLVEAKTAYYNFFQKGGSFGEQLRESVGKIQWNGMTIEDSTIRLKDDCKLMVYKKKYNGDIKLDVLDKIQCSDDLNLYYDDTDRKQFTYKRRAKTLLDAGASQVAVIQTDKPKVFKTDTGIDTAKLPKYSKVTPTILASTRVSNGVDVTKRAKHQVSVFELDWAKVKPHYVRGSKSDYWKIAEIEIDNQIFVPIDRFQPKGVFDDSLRTLRDRLLQLEVLGIDIASVKIYGLKPKQDSGDMVRLDKWILEQIAKIPNLADEVALMRDFKNASLQQFGLDALKFPINSLAREYAEQYTKARQLMTGYSRYTYDPTNKVRAKLDLAQLASLEVPNEGKLIHLETRFSERYPLIQFIGEREMLGNIEKIVDYVTLVDEARGKSAKAKAKAG